LVSSSTDSPADIICHDARLCYDWGRNNAKLPNKTRDHGPPGLARPLRGVRVPDAAPRRLGRLLSTAEKIKGPRGHSQSLKSTQSLSPGLRSPRKEFASRGANGCFLACTSVESRALFSSPWLRGADAAWLEVDAPAGNSTRSARAAPARWMGRLFDDGSLL